MSSVIADVLLFVDNSRQILEGALEDPYERVVVDLLCTRDIGPQTSQNGLRFGINLLEPCFRSFAMSSNSNIILNKSIILTNNASWSLWVLEAVRNTLGFL
jgi:hypothetical protein